MRYPHLLAAIRSAKWALQPSTLEAIRDILASRLMHSEVGAALPVGRTRSAPHTAGRLNQPGAAVAQAQQTAVVRFFGICAKRVSDMEMECGATSLEVLQSDLAAAVANPRVSKIVLHIDSPGGVITGVPELAARIAEWSKQKPIYAFADTLCASAAYWLSTGCSALFATPTADIGSIGVYMLAIDSTEAWAKEGYKAHLIKAGDRKAEGIYGVPIAPATLAIWQDEVDELYAMFTSAVRARRPEVSIEAMQGQCFMGTAALQVGLVDDIVNDLDDLLAKLD